MTTEVNTALFADRPPPWRCAWQTDAGRYWRCEQTGTWWLNDPKWLDQWNEAVARHAAKFPQQILLPIHEIGFCESHARVFADQKGSLEALIDDGVI